MQCICVFKNGKRFAHAQCLSVHNQAAVGYVKDPVLLTIQYGQMFPDQCVEDWEQPAESECGGPTCKHHGRCNHDPTGEDCYEPNSR